MKRFLIAFDLPRELASEKVKVNRELHKISAKRVQHSLWSSDSLSDLTEIGILIRKLGGNSQILEEKFLL